MRIDSSNFNPVIFWAFGIQSAALNYQTVDPSLHINSAMFEQNGGCGYVLKTSVMREKSHLMFGRFNPYEKEFDGLHTINLTITVSGQSNVYPFHVIAIFIPRLDHIWSVRVSEQQHRQSTGGSGNCRHSGGLQSAAHQTGAAKFAKSHLE